MPELPPIPAEAVLALTPFADPRLSVADELTASPLTVAVLLPASTVRVAWPLARTVDPPDCVVTVYTWPPIDTKVPGSVLETTEFAPPAVPTVGSPALGEFVAVEAVLWRITPAAIECVAVVAASWMMTPASVEIAASVCPTLVLCTPGSPTPSPLLVDTVASTAAPDPDPDPAATTLLGVAGLEMPGAELPVVPTLGVGVVACPPPSALAAVVVLVRDNPRADAMNEATPAPAELVVRVPDGVSTAIVVDVCPGVGLDCSTCSLLTVLPTLCVEEDDVSLSGVAPALLACA